MRLIDKNPKIYIISAMAMPIYKISEKAIIETFNDGGLVLILPELQLIELNPTASDIVKLLDGKRSIKQISNELINRHEIDPLVPVAQINQDVKDLLVELNKAGVVEPQLKLQENAN